MSKLLTLKTWVGISEASRYLSTVLEETVSESDIYQLALDNRLVLSVRFPRAISARLVNAYTDEEANSPLKDVTPLLIGCDQDLCFYAEGESFYPDGIFDLPLIGGEKDVVRGAAWNDEQITEICTFDYILLRLQTGELICPQTITFENYGEKPVKRHWSQFVSEARIGIKVSELNGLIGQLSTRPTEETKPTPQNSTKDSTYLNIIGVLVELIKTPRPGRNSDAAIIREMIDNYAEKPGISKRKLEEVFPAARRSLEAD